MLREYWRTKWKEKSTIFVLICFLCYLSIAFFNVNLLSFTAWEDSPSFFDANYASAFFDFGLTFITVPLFYIFLLPNLSFFQKDCICVRFGSLGRYRTTWSITLLAECGVYVVSLYFLLFLRAVIFGQAYGFYRNGIFLLKAAISQIFCFFVLALLDCCMALLTNSTIFGFVFSYCFVIYDYVAMQTGLPRLFVYRTAALVPSKMQNYWINLLLIVAITALVDFACFSAVILKDRLPKKVD